MYCVFKDNFFDFRNSLLDVCEWYSGLWIFEGHIQD